MSDQEVTALLGGWEGYRIAAAQAVIADKNAAAAVERGRTV